MRTYTDDILEEVTRMAGLFLTYREIGVLLKVENLDDFLQDMNNPFHPLQHAHYFGVTKAKHDIRKKVVTLATMGSPQAEQLAEKYMQDLDTDTHVR